MNELDNKIILGDCIQEMKKMPSDYFDLVIADPPYWKVVNEKWDYQWKTEEEYIRWCFDWFSELYRIMRYGGTFYLFGYFRTLALLVSSLNNIGFSLRQQIIINKGMKSVAGRATKNYKMFPNVTESILFLIKNNIPYSRELLKQQQKKKGLSSKEINELLGVKTNGGGMWSIYTGKNVCEQFPTKEIWEKLQQILDIDIEYSKISQTFNPEMGITDVWDDISFTQEKRIHPTQKPSKLIERLIKASSNSDDKILDLFSGSGTTFMTSLKLNRFSTAIEINEEYVKNINFNLSSNLYLE